MKKLFFLFFSMILILIINSCATGGGTLTILDTSFNPESKISLLPPRFNFESTGNIGIGSEVTVGRMIYDLLVERTPADWLSPEESVSLIQDADVLEDYEELLEGYQRTGIPSKAKLQSIMGAVECPYIALCQIDHRISGVQGMSGYRFTNITIQILSAAEGKVVLELLGEAECGSGSFDVGASKLMETAINKAINFYPGSVPLKKNNE
ncbi:MAG: hypothetical protein APR54_09085 [Candidatus Cloacimonas sp. SDB]|nr:MAG: hypothetical protein APR54_09085 [Candidatus Cloacimonas sp. SDB]